MSFLSVVHSVNKRYWVNHNMPAIALGSMGDQRVVIEFALKGKYLYNMFIQKATAQSRKRIQRKHSGNSEKEEINFNWETYGKDSDSR